MQLAFATSDKLYRQAHIKLIISYQHTIFNAGNNFRSLQHLAIVLKATTLPS